jgi:hypothetical protein
MFGPIQVSIDAFHADVEAQLPSILDQHQNAGLSMNSLHHVLRGSPHTKVCGLHGHQTWCDAFSNPKRSIKSHSDVRQICDMARLEF